MRICLSKQRKIWRVRDGAVLRVLFSHKCGPGSNPGVDAICGLSLSLVLSFAPRGFSPRIAVFPSPQKTTFPNSNSIRNQVDEEPLRGMRTSLSPRQWQPWTAVSSSLGLISVA